jgi:hypothetical protein
MDDSSLNSIVGKVGTCMCAFFFQVTGSYFSSGLDPRGLLDPGWEKIGIVKFI